MEDAKSGKSTNVEEKLGTFVGSGLEKQYACQYMPEKSLSNANYQRVFLVARMPLSKNVYGFLGIGLVALYWV